MLLATRCGSKAMAFSGMSICVAEKRENDDLGWGIELGEAPGPKLFTEVSSCEVLLKEQ